MDGLKIKIEAYIAEVFSDESGFFFSNVYAVTMVPFFAAITATIIECLSFGQYNFNNKIAYIINLLTSELRQIQ